MAKTNEEFDRIFREKLENHQEKPSALAWERLNHQLPASKSSNRGIWWAIAASVAVVIVSGWMFWNNSGEVAQDQLLAEEDTATEGLTTTQDRPTTSAESVEIPSQTELTEDQESQNQATVNRSAPKQNQVNTTQNIGKEKLNPSSEIEKSQALIAMNEQSTKELQVAVPPVSIEIKEATLPAIQPTILQQTVAEATPADDDAPLYRINIYSDGIKKGAEPDKNLITEMGKTVGKVEGLLGKVDEGFADLQDKKNNLFTTLTSRK
jgi:hypothetical protein